MYGKRLKAYRQTGYEIYSEKDTEKQATDAIFDLDKYFEVYKYDLLKANGNIIEEKLQCDIKTLGNYIIGKIIGEQYLALLLKELEISPEEWSGCPM